MAKVSRKNYKVESDEVVEESAEISEPVVEETPMAEPEEVAVEEIPMAEQADLNVTKLGEVAGCEMLNVRVEPTKHAIVLQVLSFGDVVEVIDEDGDFYKVAINNDGDKEFGYCMKQYINIE